MKCPRCNFVASHKKDLCPRCDIDLRPRKRELGLPISNSVASYETLLAQHQAEKKRQPATPTPSVLPTHPAAKADQPVQGKTPFWKKLLGKKADHEQPVTELTPVQPAPPKPTPPKPKEPPLPPTVVHSPKGATKVSEPTAATAPAAGHYAATPEEADPLLFQLDALSEEIAANENRLDDEPKLFDDDGLEFNLSEPEPQPQAFSASPKRPSERSAESGGLQTVSTEPTPSAPIDLQELISALDKLNPDAKASEGDDLLFGGEVPGMDSNLDEIIQALDEIEPEADLDEIELFQTKLDDLAESLGTSVGAAKDAASELRHLPFDSEPDENDESSTEEPELDAFEKLLGEADPVPAPDFVATVEQSPLEVSAPEVPESVPAQQPNEFDIVIGAEEQDQPAVLQVTPLVTPEVLEFSEDDDEALERTLDELIGDAVLDVQAVKTPRSTAPAKEEQHSYVSDDGMEISFEVEVEGAEDEPVEAADESEPVHDEILSDLLDTFHSMQAGTEQMMLAPERKSSAHDPAPVLEPASFDSELPHIAFEDCLTPSARPERPPVLEERVNALMARLSFLSEDLLSEISALVYNTPSSSRQASYDPASASATSADEDLLLSDAELEQLSVIDDSNERELFSVELDEAPTDYVDSLDEVAALEELSPVVDATQGASNLELLQQELATDHEEPVEECTDMTLDLEDLQAELADELSALEAEGLSVYSADEPAQDEPVVEMQSAAAEEAPCEADADLEALQSELSDELSALEAEGLSVYSAEEPAEAEPAVEMQSPTAEETPFEADADLEALQSELSDELSALEAEGLSVYSADETAQVEPVLEMQSAEAEEVPFEADADLEALQSELSDELSALEAEGLSVYSADEPAQDEPVVQMQSPTAEEAPFEADADLEALQSELSDELSALEAEGLSVYSADEPARDEPVLETQDAVAEEAPFEAAATEEVPFVAEADLEALQSELSDELSALEAEGLSVYSADETAEETPIVEMETAGAEEVPFEADVDLEALQSELSDELSALEAEGLSVYSADEPAKDEPVVETQNAGAVELPFEAGADLEALQSELSDEPSAVEAEEPVEVEATVEMQSEPIDEAPVRADFELAALQSELSEELSALEAEGLSVYSAEESADMQIVPTEHVLERTESNRHPLEDLNTAEECAGPVAGTQPESHASEVASTAIDAALEDHDRQFEALENRLGEELSGLNVEDVTSQLVAVPTQIFEQSAEANVDLPEDTLSSEEVEAASDTLAMHSDHGSSHDEEFQPAEDTSVLAPEGGEEPAESSDEETQVARPSIDRHEDEAFSPQSTGAFLLSDLASLMESADGGPSEIHEQPEPVLSDVQELPSADATGSFLLQDLAGHLNATEDQSESSPDAQLESSVPTPELSSVSPEDVSLELDDGDDATDDETRVPKANEPLDSAVNTGTFLASDFANIVDLVAGERFEPSSEDADQPDTSNGFFEGNEEIELDQLAALFNGEGATDEAPGGLKLESAVSTGSFLAADLARIVDTPPVPPVAESVPPPVVSDEMWEAAEATLHQAIDHQSEVELSAGDFTTFRQTEALDVLFDLAEEDLADPSGARKRVTEIPRSDEKQVENISLKQALNVFEKEERILSRRRSKVAAGEIVEAAKPIVHTPVAAWRRAGALCVDSLTVFVLSVIFASIGLLPAELSQPLLKLHMADEMSYVPYICELLGVSFVLWLLSSTMLIAGWGQTFGAHFFKIEVVSVRGDTPGLKQAMLRSLGQVTTLLTLGSGYLPVLLKRRALHDALSCTLVRAKE
ncbi:MAG: RDD family protein [Bdellovibrionota bacterium]